MSVLVSVLISMLVLVMKVSINVIGAGITDINPVTILIQLLIWILNLRKMDLNEEVQY